MYDTITSFAEKNEKQYCFIGTSPTGKKDLSNGLF